MMMYLRDNSDTERDSGPGWRISPSDAERWFPVVIVDDAHSEERVEQWSRARHRQLAASCPCNCNPGPTDPNW